MTKTLQRLRRRRLVRVIAVAATALVAAVGSVETAAAHPSRDLAVAVVGPSQARQGADVTYVLAVRNVGHDAAQATTVSFSVPRGWRLRSAVSSSGQCIAAAHVCRVGDLAGDTSATATVRLRAMTAGARSFTARASASFADENAANNAAKVATSVAPTRCRLDVGSGESARLPAGTVAVTVRLLGRPVANERVVATANGARAAARTDARGRARLSLGQATTGTVTVAVPTLGHCQRRVSVAGSSGPGGLLPAPDHPAPDVIVPGGEYRPARG